MAVWVGLFLSGPFLLETGSILLGIYGHVHSPYSFWWYLYKVYILSLPLSLSLSPHSTTAARALLQSVNARSKLQQLSDCLGIHFI